MHRRPLSQKFFKHEKMLQKLYDLLKEILPSNDIYKFTTIKIIIGTRSGIWARHSARGWRAYV